MSLHNREAHLLDQSSCCAQQPSKQSTFILQLFSGSGRTEDEIRAAVYGLREIVQRESTDNVIETNTIYLQHLEKALQKINKADANHLLSNSNPAGAYPTVHEEKKQLSTNTSHINGRKEMESQFVPYLPPEIMAMIISQTLLQEPKCVLDLVVPDWSVCHRENPELEKLLKMTRIVTYTRGIGCQPGTLSCQFGHGKEDHILTSMAEFLPNALEVNVSYSSEYIRQFYRCHTHVFNLGTGNIPMETVEDVLVSNWKDLLPLRGQRMKALLPFDDEPIDTIKVRMIPFATPIYEHLRHIAVHSPLELMKIHAEGLNKDGRAVHQQQVEALNNALDLDRSAHLWLSWSQMPNLESVFLDLRLYSHDLNTERRCLSKLHVIARAQEMGRHLRLKTLLLAGLQSYSFETEYDGITAEHIENWNEIDGEPNWFKIFSPSVREGGKIILVDKLADSLQK